MDCKISSVKTKPKSLSCHSSLNSGTCVIRHNLYTNERFTIDFKLSNPTHFSYPNECRIRQLPLYTKMVKSTDNSCELI